MHKYLTFFLCLALVISGIGIYLWLQWPPGRYACWLRGNILYYFWHYDHKIVLPPYHYTGIWTFWDEDGFQSEYNYVNGEKKGKVSKWNKDGKLCRETFIDEANSRERKWFDGNEAFDGIYYNSQPWYGSFCDSDVGSIPLAKDIHYYIDYKMVSADEYRRWELETGGIPEILRIHPEIKR